MSYTQPAIHAAERTEEVQPAGLVRHDKVRECAWEVPGLGRGRSTLVVVRELDADLVRGLGLGAFVESFDCGANESVGGEVEGVDEFGCGGNFRDVGYEGSVVVGVGVVGVDEVAVFGGLDAELADAGGDFGNCLAGVEGCEEGLVGEGEGVVVGCEGVVEFEVAPGLAEFDGGVGVASEVLEWRGGGGGTRGGFGDDGFELGGFAEEDFGDDASVGEIFGFEGYVAEGPDGLVAVPWRGEVFGEDCGEDFVWWIVNMFLSGGGSGRTVGPVVVIEGQIVR